MNMLLYELLLYELPLYILLYSNCITGYMVVNLWNI